MCLCVGVGVHRYVLCGWCGRMHVFVCHSVGVCMCACKCIGVCV